MAQILELNINNPDALLQPDNLGPGAVVGVERGLAQSGPFTEILTPPLVSAQTFYRIADASGTVDHWYRFRTRSSSGAQSSRYSDAFRAGALRAYASLDDLVEGMNLPGGAHATDRYNLLADRLIDGSEFIDSKCGRTFFRSPQVDGDSTFLIGPFVRTSLSLVTALGKGVDIVSVTTLEIQGYLTGPFETVAVGDTGYSLASPSYPGWPYEDLFLSPYGGVRTVFPAGGYARLTGAMGFPSVPNGVKRGLLDMVTEMDRQVRQGGVPSGVNQFGVPVFMSGLPVTAYSLWKKGSRYRKESWASN